MGRRIPKSKRHKKVKAVDPFYSGDRKALLDTKAHKSNTKPSNPSVQEVPRRLRELMESCQQVKDGKFKRKRKTKNPQERESRILNDPDYRFPGANVTQIKRLKGEPDHRFVARVNRISKEAVVQSEMETKFDVRIVEDDEGKVEVEKRGFLEDKLNSDGKPQPSTAKKLKRKQLEEKRKAKKIAKIEDKKDAFGHLRDDIKFGEVVHAPPSLKFGNKKAKNSSTLTRKPGAKPLLLKNMLDQSGKHTIDWQAVTSVSPGATVDLTVKRKLLSVADRRLLDTERDKVVNSYKMLKFQRQRHPSNANMQKTKPKFSES